MIPYRSEQPHDCGGTIREGAPMFGGWRTPAYFYCDRCGAFRWEDAPGFFPSGTDAKANRDAWDDGDLRSPDAPDDSGDDAERGEHEHAEALGTDLAAERADALDRAAIRAELCADYGDDAEREPWPPQDDRPEYARQPDDAPEDPPDPDGEGPLVPMGGAS